MEITVFDEHNEAFLFWEEAIKAKKFKKNSILFHVDGHSDMGKPDVTESIYSKNVKNLTEKQLTIGNFILAAVLRGVFNEIIFLGRGVSTSKRQRFFIGTFKGEGIWVNKFGKINKLIEQLYPDLKTCYYAVIDELDGVNLKSAVLDIDMDYFYGHIYPQPQIGLRITEDQVKKIKKDSISEDKYRLSLLPFKIDKKVLFPYLGFRHKDIIYNNSKEWIECAIRYFVESIRFKPQLISICRSVKSGYTPKQYGDFVENTLIRYLTDKQKKPIDPCEISAPFEIYPFIARVKNLIYNPFNDKIIHLKRDSRLIWEKMEKNKNFPQIYKEMSEEYNVRPEILKKVLLNFIFRLKKSLFIK